MLEVKKRQAKKKRDEMFMKGSLRGRANTPEYIHIRLLWMRLSHRTFDALLLPISNR
eukprot:gene7103-5036_t